MAIQTFLCVYLLSCISSQISPIDSPKCPKSLCQCFKAPKGGFGDDSSLSLVCDWSAAELTQPQDWTQLTAESINSLRVNNFVTGLDNTISGNIPNLLGLSVNNLELYKCDFTPYDSNNPFVGLKKENLMVLSFIETRLSDQENGRSFDWTHFSEYNNLKAIHIESGQLTQIKSNLGTIGGNVIALTIDKTGLESIDKTTFSHFKQLKMLSVVGNHLTSVEWLDSVESPLWYLDLRQNQMTSFPLSIARKLTNLRTLKLGGNKIHVIDGQTGHFLMRQVKELTFDTGQGANGELVISDSDYFIPTKEMIWLNDILSKEHDQTSQESMVNYYGLSKMNCMQWDREGLQSCSKLEAKDYINVESDHFTVVDMKNSAKESFLSFNNKKAFLSGAVFPGNWFFNNLTYFFDKVVAAEGNVIKVDLDVGAWLSLTQPENFAKMLDSLEVDLQYIEEKDMFVIITLWTPNTLPVQMFGDGVFESYVDLHLRPMVQRLNKFKSLAAWNLIDEPERMVKANQRHDSDKCLDTRQLVNPDPIHHKVSIDRMQWFIGKQAMIIHEVSPRKLVTIGMSLTNTFCKEGFIHFEDQCLKNVLQDDCTLDNCYLDFYSVLVKQNDLPETIKHYRFRPQDVSSEFPKPVIVIAEENFKKITDIYKYGSEDTNWDLVKLWKHQGILATFNINKQDEANTEIEKGIKHLRTNREIGKQIFGPNRSQRT